MKSQDYKKAAKLLDNSIDKLGQEPDLMIRKAVVNIKLKRLKAEPISLKELETPKSNPYDEINEIAQRSDRKGKFKAIRKDDSLIYVQDHPALSNIDWSNPIENSLPLNSGKTRVYKLQDGDIGDVKLDDLGFDGTRLPPGDDGNNILDNNGNGGSGNDPKTSGFSNSGYYRFYRGNFSRQLVGCLNSKEDKEQTGLCKQEEENNVYVMYVRD